MDSTLFDNIGRKLAPEQVTSRLREAIASGLLRPGERINQADLAERLGVSRMPVREALHRLHSEGLVTLQPYRGAVVAGLSKRELQEIYEMRMALEALALRIGFRSGNPELVAEADRILQRMDRARESSEWLSLNTAFHDLLYSGADRPLLLENIGVLRNKSDRYLRLFAAKRDRTVHAQEEHWAIVAALRKRRIEDACRRLQEHLQSTIDSLAESLPDEGAEATEFDAETATPRVSLPEEE